MTGPINMVNNLLNVNPLPRSILMIFRRYEITQFILGFTSLHCIAFSRTINYKTCFLNRINHRWEDAIYMQKYRKNHFSISFCVISKKKKERNAFLWLFVSDPSIHWLFSFKHRFLLYKTAASRHIRTYLLPLGFCSVNRQIEFWNL